MRSQSGFPIWDGYPGCWLSGQPFVTTLRRLDSGDLHIAGLRISSAPPASLQEATAPPVRPAVLDVAKGRRSVFGDPVVDRIAGPAALRAGFVLRPPGALYVLGAALLLLLLATEPKAASNDG